MVTQATAVFSLVRYRVEVFTLRVDESLVLAVRERYGEGDQVECGQEPPHADTLASPPHQVQ